MSSFFIQKSFVLNHVHTYNINHLKIEKKLNIFTKKHTHKIQTNTYVTITWQTKKASFKEKFFWRRSWMAIGCSQTCPFVPGLD